MNYKHTTQVPNFVFAALPNFTEAELKITLTVIRQTYGWLDKRTGKRKIKDRISGSQFRLKTGLSKRTIIKTVHSLVSKNILSVTDCKGNELRDSADRMGKRHLYYSLAAVLRPPSSGALKRPEPVHKGSPNKTNPTKLNTYSASQIGNMLPDINTLF